MEVRFEKEFWSQVQLRSNGLERVVSVKKTVIDDTETSVKSKAKQKRTLKRQKIVVQKNFFIDSAITNAIDLNYNPYPEQVICPNRNGWRKVQFIDTDENGDDVHKYLIFDKRGGYDGDIIVSASMFHTYMRRYASEPHDVDLKNLTIDLKNQPCFFSFNAEQKFGNQLAVISNLYVAYLNAFAADPFDIDPPKRLSQTYMQRRRNFFALQEPCLKPKDFMGFVPTIVFKEMEAWLYHSFVGVEKSKNELFVESRHEDVCLFLRFLGKSGLEKLKHGGLRAMLIAYEPNILPATVHDIISCYKTAADAGTRLHKYLEFRLSDPDVHTMEHAKKEYKCREEEDYEQAEEIVRYVQEKKLNVQVEVPLLSYLHKFCGSIDCLAQHPDGTFQIIDYKRTQTWVDDEWFLKGDHFEPRRTQLCYHALTSDVIKYAIQTAVYRKLAILNGYNVCSTAILPVVHPSLPHVHFVELHLNEKMAADVNDIHFNGIGKVFGDQEGQSLSPIEYVELGFMFRIEQLKRYFNIPEHVEMESLAGGVWGA